MTTQQLISNLFANDIFSAGEATARFPYFKLVHLHNFVQNADDEQARKMVGIHFTQHYWLSTLVPNAVDSAIAANGVAETISSSPIAAGIMHEGETPLPTVEPVSINNPKADAADEALTALESTDTVHEVATPLHAEESVGIESTRASAEDAAEALLEKPKATAVEESHQPRTSLHEEAIAQPARQVHEVEAPLPTQEPVSVNNARKENFDTATAKLEAATEAPGTTPAPLFEPLHTTDYFASQGIKISEEAMANDNMGRQLRSFTQWLKTMKRLPGSMEQKMATANIDVKVEEMASRSNAGTEVLTEAMASAYLKQNKPERAREIYAKLSLLHPEKSSYFAALIEKI